MSRDEASIPQVVGGSMEKGTIHPNMRRFRGATNGRRFAPFRFAATAATRGLTIRATTSAPRRARSGHGASPSDAVATVARGIDRDDRPPRTVCVERAGGLEKGNGVQTAPQRHRRQPEQEYRLSSGTRVAGSAAPLTGSPPASPKSTGPAPPKMILANCRHGDYRHLP